MLTCKIEFDNNIASPLSPREFIEHYVFGDRVKFISYNKKTKTAVYNVISPAVDIWPETKIMTIRMKNLNQL